jgi:hypothetical protein
MVCMSGLEYRHKIPGRSVASVREAYEDALLRLQRETKMPFGNRTAFTAEAFTNAIVLHFLSLPHEDQAAIVREHVPRFEALASRAGVIRLETTREPVRNPAPKNRRKPGSE